MLVKCAITGGIASGKTTALNYLRKKYSCISADEEIEKIYILKKVQEELKKELQIEDGTKEGVKKILFTNPNKIKTLERILYKYLFKNFSDFERMCRRRNRQICFFEIPLLFEKSMQKKYDFIINIETPIFLQKRNFLKRKQDIKIFNFLIKKQFALQKKIFLTKKFHGINIKNNVAVFAFKQNLSRDILKMLDNGKNNL